MRKINTRDFNRATRTTPREVNRQIILNLIREHQPVSRADLARRMDVARAMVTPLVNELLEERLIYEGATGKTTRGRKPRLLHIRTEDRLAVAIDVRLSRTHVMLSDLGGRELAIESFPTPRSMTDLAAELTKRIRALRDAHAGVGCCEGVGLVVPGMVDHETGRILNAPTLGWRDVDLRGALAAGAGLPVHIERDAVACAMAQIWLGQNGSEGGDSFVYVTVSDGVGAGVVVNREVVRGHRDTAGEFGHVPLNLDGPPCLCGARGCLEAYTSNHATMARYLGMEISTRDTHMRIGESGLTVTDIIAKARAGDGTAREALQVTSRYLGIGLAIIINALNPARIIVGGEISGGWDMLSGAIHSAVAERTLTTAASRTPITPEPEDGRTRLRGATALVVAPVFAAPQVA